MAKFQCLRFNISPNGKLNVPNAAGSTLDLLLVLRKKYTHFRKFFTASVDCKLCIFDGWQHSGGDERRAGNVPSFPTSQYISIAQHPTRNTLRAYTHTHLHKSRTNFKTENGKTGKCLMWSSAKCRRRTFLCCRQVTSYETSSRFVFAWYLRYNLLVMLQWPTGDERRREDHFAKTNTSDAFCELFLLLFWGEFMRSRLKALTAL